MDVVEFLRARMAKDEQIARAGSGAPWTASASGTIQVDEAAPGWSHLGFVATVENEAYAEHIARRDPARSLREAAVLRQLIEEYEKQAWVLEQGQRSAAEESAQAVRETLLRRFAAVHDDHPDYREEWRVAGD